MRKFWTVFEDESLTASQAGVYICLCKHQGKNEDGFPSKKTIAKETHLSMSTVKRAIRVLADKKYIEIVPQKRPNGGDSSNRYKCLR